MPIILLSLMMSMSVHAKGLTSVEKDLMQVHKCFTVMDLGRGKLFAPSTGSIRTVANAGSRNLYENWSLSDIAYRDPAGRISYITVKEHFLKNKKGKTKKPEVRLLKSKDPVSSFSKKLILDAGRKKKSCPIRINREGEFETDQNGLYPAPGFYDKCSEVEGALKVKASKVLVSRDIVDAYEKSVAERLKNTNAGFIKRPGQAKISSRYRKSQYQDAIKSIDDLCGEIPDSNVKDAIAAFKASVEKSFPGSVRRTKSSEGRGEQNAGQ